MITPKSENLVQDYLRRCGGLPIGTRPPDPPGDIAAFAIEDRVGLAVQLIEERLAGRFQGPAHFGADLAIGLLLKTKEAPSGSDLERLLHAIGAGGPQLCGLPWEYAWKEAQREIGERGLTPSLHDALRAMQGAMKVHTSDKNAALQIDRALWFASWTPLDPAQDAADVVRRDLRTRPDAEAWRALLLHGMNGAGAESFSPSWLKKAKKLLVPEAGSRLRGWLDGVAALPELRLSKTGGDALRAVVWASVAAESVPLPAILAICGRPWQRGSAWSTRQDRFIGALAWSLEQSPSPGGRQALSSLQSVFGRTSAKEAIDRALAVQPQ